MRILHVSNFGEKHNGRIFWNQCFKITNGLIRNGHSVYTFSDRDESRKNILNKISNNKIVNNKLIYVFKNYNPELIILGHADRINNRTLEIIRSINKDIKIIEWNVDNYHLDNTEKKLTQRSRLLNGIFITTADESISSSINNNFISFFPNIFDQSIERLKIFDQISYESDIFFALSNGVSTGTLRKKNIDNEVSNPRIIFLKDLKNKLCDSVKFDFYGFNGINPIWASDFEKKIVRCHSSICIQKRPQLKYSMSDRITQYMGNGLMTYINYNTKLDELLEDNKEAVFYHDEHDLAEKILKNSNNLNIIRSIAKAGWKKCHKDFNECVVTKYIVDLTMYGKAESPWKQHIYK